MKKYIGQYKQKRMPQRLLKAKISHLDLLND